jgi:hypothetical protein
METVFGYDQTIPPLETGQHRRGGKRYVIEKKRNDSVSPCYSRKKALLGVTVAFFRTRVSKAFCHLDE